MPLAIKINSPDNTPTLSPVSIRLDSSKKQDLADIAKATNRKPHAIAKQAIEDFIEREKARLDFKRETDAAWQHFQETGLHVNQVELFTWIDSLFTDTEQAPPVCHTPQ